MQAIMEQLLTFAATPNGIAATLLLLIVGCCSREVHGVTQLFVYMVQLQREKLLSQSASERSA